MPESVVVVQKTGNGYVEGAKVTLAFTFGMTDTVRTDSNGEAVIEHASTGEATVYVNGRKCTSMNTPGRKLVFI